MITICLFFSVLKYVRWVCIHRSVLVILLFFELLAVLFCCRQSDNRMAVFTTLRFSVPQAVAQFIFCPTYLVPRSIIVVCVFKNKQPQVACFSTSRVLQIFHCMRLNCLPELLYYDDCLLHQPSESLSSFWSILVSNWSILSCSWSQKVVVQRL
jgi:hypothetical protein